MEEPNQFLLKNIEEFKNTFSKYFNAFMEYLRGGIVKDSEFLLGHPTLFLESNKLQVAYLKIPESLRNRLLNIEFDVFLHCNNQVDFFSFRSFLLEKNRFHETATIAERVDNEIDLAIMLIKNEVWDEYCKLPNRNFHFYRGHKPRPKIMDELRLDFEERLQEQLETNDRQHDVINNEIINNIEEEYSFFDNATDKINKTDKIMGSADSILGKAVSLINTIGKFL